MAILVDSNVLVFLVQQEHPWHEESKRALKFFLSTEDQVIVFLQNIAEFWNVCARPADKNGLGLSVTESERRLGELELIVTLLPDATATYQQWRRLVLQHEVKGVEVHDARLAAGMIVHGITRILTYNPKDFKRYREIIAIHPRRLVSNDG